MDLRPICLQEIASKELLKPLLGHFSSFIILLYPLSLSNLLGEILCPELELQKDGSFNDYPHIFLIFSLLLFKDFP